MQKNIGKLLISLCVLVLGILPVFAQEDDTFVPYQRLVMLRTDSTRTGFFSGYGDLYSWSPGESSLFQETSYGYNGRPVLSLDGTKIMYQSIPQEFVEGDVDLNNWLGPLPTNIWLMDLTTAPDDPTRFVRIADQESGLPDDADENTWQRRSLPVWSPDSIQVAWVELDLINTAFSGRIRVYDTRTGETTIAATEVSLGFADAGNWDIPNLLGWGSAIAHTTVNAGVYPDLPQGGFGTVLDLYDTTGLIFSIPISYFNNPEDRLTQVRWVMHRNEWQLALQYPEVGWVVMNPLTQSYERLQNAPFLQAVAGGEWAGHPVSVEPLTLEWRNNGTVRANLPSYEPVTFSPDGTPLWISESGELVTVEGESHQSLLPLTDDGLNVMFAVWTPGVWMTNSEGTSITPQIMP